MKKQTKKKIRKVKAWILEFNGYFTPMVSFIEPTPKEKKTAKKFGSEYYPCTITYSLPLT